MLESRNKPADHANHSATQTAAVPVNSILSRFSFPTRSELKTTLMIGDFVSFKPLNENIPFKAQLLDMGKEFFQRLGGMFTVVGAATVVGGSLIIGSSIVEQTLGGIGFGAGLAILGGLIARSFWSMAKYFHALRQESGIHNETKQ